MLKQDVFLNTNAFYFIFDLIFRIPKVTYLKAYLCEFI